MSEELINDVGYESPETGGDDDFLGGKTLVSEPEAKEPDAKQPEDGEELLDGKQKQPGEAGQKPKEKAPDGKPPVEKKDELSGFASRFLKKDEKGGSAFDADSALSFIKPGDGKDASFRYELKPRKAAEDQPQAPAEPVNPFKQRIEERKKWRTERESETYLWKKTYSDAIRAGYDGPSALQAADGKVREHIEEKQAEWEYEQENKNAEERNKSEIGVKQQAEARSARIANEQRYVQRLGGYEQYNEFLFGKKGADGKMSRGYASDFVSKLFDTMNPEAQQVTQEDMTNWWDKFASDSGNMQLVFDVAMSRLQQDLFPRLMQKAVDVHKETERQKGIGKMRKAGDGSRSIAPDVGEMPGDLAGFLRPPNSNEAVDTI